MRVEFTFNPNYFGTEEVPLATAPQSRANVRARPIVAFSALLVVLPKPSGKGTSTTAFPEHLGKGKALVIVSSTLSTTLPKPSSKGKAPAITSTFANGPT